MTYSIKRAGWIAATTFTVFFTVGCSKGTDQVEVRPTAIPPNASAEPAATNASPVKSEITKQQQSNQMPMPGQANDHSTLDPAATQKNHKP